MKLNDPHVETLTYAVTTDESISYRDDAVLEADTPLFGIRIADKLAVLRLKDHFASENEAIGAVSPYLKAWEIDAALRMGLGVFRLDYRGASVIDRQPDNTHVIELSGRCEVKFSCFARATIIKAIYPEPPRNFVTDYYIEDMWRRYELAVKKRESVTSAAYYCLTAIEYAFGGRSSAGRSLQVCLKVLQELGRLSSEGGDAMTGRKYPKPPLTKAGTQELRKPANLHAIAHSDTELAWLLDVMKQLIRRAGEYAADPDGAFPLITMASLPSLHGQTGNSTGV